jgi:hypothetical protein
MEAGSLALSVEIWMYIAAMCMLAAAIWFGGER